MKLNKQHQLETYQLFPEHVKIYLYSTLFIGPSVFMLKCLSSLQSILVMVTEL